MLAVSTNCAHQTLKGKPANLQMLIKGVTNWLRPAKCSDWPKLGAMWYKHIANKILYLMEALCTYGDRSLISGILNLRIIMQRKCIGFTS